MTWTHDWLRTGIGSRKWGFGVPNKPAYAIPTREPGMMMGRLLPKVKSWAHKIIPNPTQAQEMFWRDWAKETALGFARHNAMDRKVHFSYFWASGTNPEAWTIDHGQKERWADMMLLGAPACFYGADNGGELITFNDRGLPNDNGVIVPIDGNPMIIHLAQKVARKNRQCMDMKNDHVTPDPKTAWKKVQSMSTIDSIIAGMESKMTKHLNGYNLTKNDGAWLFGWAITDYNFTYLQVQARKRGWTVDGLLQKVTESQAAAQKIE